MKDADLRIMCAKALKAGLSKNLVGVNDLDAHLSAQGVKLVDRTPTSLVIPKVVGKTIVKAKVMLDMNKMRFVCIFLRDLQYFFIILKF